MSDAPERIWAEDVSKEWKDDSGVWGVDKEAEHDVEYIRKDISDARIAELEAERDALAEALRKIAEAKPHHAGQTANEYHFQKQARAALAKIK